MPPLFLSLVILRELSFLSLKRGMEEVSKDPAIQKETAVTCSSDLLHHVDYHLSVGSDGFQERVPKKLVEVLTSHLPSRTSSPAQLERSQPAGELPLSHHYSRRFHRKIYRSLSLT